MKRIKYIKKSDKFFVKEYNDGIIVAFMDCGQNSASFADQIHQVVITEINTSLFASDIIAKITGLEKEKRATTDSLFIHGKNLIISGSGVNKEGIFVKYNSDVILIENRKSFTIFYSVLIFLTICVVGYNFIPDDEDDIIVEPSNELQGKKENELHKKTVVIANTGNTDTPENIEPVIPQDFILIPSGVLKKCHAGYDNNWNDIYEDVALDSFYICNHEVTQKEYIQVMETNPSFIAGDDLPVNAVQFIDAIKYCNARSEAEGYDGFYIIDNNNITIKPHSNGYRLPNRYEWAYSARRDGATKTKYASGGSIAKVAWYGGNSKNTLHTICTKESNGRGIYDMNGNVDEWLWDKEFEKFNCYIGGNFMSYIGFNENDVYGSTVCSESNGFRVVLITEKLKNNNVTTPLTLRYFTLEYYHAVEEMLRQERENAERERKREALKAEANEYIRIADRAYSAYCKDFDEKKGVTALSNYKKALELVNEHNLFFSKEKEIIKKKITALEVELKIDRIKNL